MILGELLLRMREVCWCDRNVSRRGRTRILTDSARKKKKTFWQIIIKQELTATIMTVG